MEKVMDKKFLKAIEIYCEDYVIIEIHYKEHQRTI